MARIIGVEVPPNKRIEIALRYVYGIGPTNSKEILAKAKAYDWILVGRNGIGIGYIPLSRLAPAKP